MHTTAAALFGVSTNSRAGKFPGIDGFLLLIVCMPSVYCTQDAHSTTVDTDGQPPHLYLGDLYFCCFSRCWCELAQL